MTDKSAQTSANLIGQRSPRSAQASLGAIILAFEFVVIFLGSLAVFGLHILSAPVALIGGGALTIAVIVLIPLLRHRWAIVLGWVLQLIVLGSGLVLWLAADAPGYFVGTMVVVGAIFLALWAYCMIMGARIDRIRHSIMSHEATPNTDLASSDPVETENPE